MIVTEKLTAMRLEAAEKCFSDDAVETLRYMNFPRKQGRRIQSNNMLERIMKEIRRRTRVVDAFSMGNVP